MAAQTTAADPAEVAKFDALAHRFWDERGDFRPLHLLNPLRAEFVATREKRDASLPLPDLMLAALQVNIRGGRLPDADKCGTAFLKVPLNRFGPGAS